MFKKDQINNGDREVTVYTVGTKEVVFDSIDWSGFETLRRNPYLLSGTLADTAEGSEAALLYSAALSMQFSTDTDALFWAAYHGHTQAMQEVISLAKKGEELIASEREKYARSIAPREGAYSLDLRIEDLYLVHATKYDPHVDQDGNIVLRPAGDWAEAKWETGEVYERNTLHFALNHMVQAIWERSNDGMRNVIIVPLKAVIEANPGALDTLYVVDTYFTPAPGAGLIIPAGQYKVVQPGEVNSTLRAMGAKVLQGCDAYCATQGADAAVAKIASEMQVGFGLHSHQPCAMLEGIQLSTFADPASVWHLARISRNARLRAYTTIRYTGSKVWYQEVDCI